MWLGGTSRNQQAGRRRRLPPRCLITDDGVHVWRGQPRGSPWPAGTPTRAASSSSSYSFSPSTLWSSPCLSLLLSHTLLYSHHVSSLHSSPFFSHLFFLVVSLFFLFPFLFVSFPILYSPSLYTFGEPTPVPLTPTTLVLPFSSYPRHKVKKDFTMTGTRIRRELWANERQRYMYECV